MPSPSPQIFVELGHGLIDLWLLDSRVIQWHILEDGICPIELFGGISSDLVAVLQFRVKIYVVLLCGKGSSNLLSFHAPYYDVVTTFWVIAYIGYLRLPTCLTKQHHIVEGARFGQDQTSVLGHIKMAMSRFIAGWHMSGTFRPQINVILGINSNAAIFVNLLIALLCICVGECSTFGGLLASCFGNMVTN